MSLEKVLTADISKTTSVLIVAAEESSCKYALKVMKHMKSEGKRIHFWGIGNREMEAYGFERVARSEDLAVMGLFEILKNQKKIRNAFKEVLQQVSIKQTQVALLLDYGGFNLKLAKSLKHLGLKILYYIPPKVWVWKKNRIYKIKKFVDDVLVIHPFEVGFYKNYGVDVKYVGHPLLEEYNEFKSTKFSPKVFKHKHGLDNNINIGFMPGSRNFEVELLFEPMIEAASKLVELTGNVSITFLVAPAFEIEDFKNRLKRRYEFPIHFIKEDSWKMIDSCDYMVTASGTATLQVGLLKKPQVIVYKMNPLSGKLAKLIVRGIKNFGLVNIILGEVICPELYQKEVEPTKIANLVFDLIHNKENKRDRMLVSYQKLEDKLKGDGAAKLVSNALLKYL